MDGVALLLSLAAVAVLSIIIMYICNSFDAAASYLGRNMAPGIKGATINAVGSSMPELLTTMAFLFLFKDIDGFSAGIATAAGSAIFNGLIIPAACILAVTFIGVKKNGSSIREKINHFSIGRNTIIRDGFWLIIGELLLIVFLGNHILTWLVGASLVVLYIGYIIHVLWDNHQHNLKSLTKDNIEENDDEIEQTSNNILHAILTFDFHYIFYKNQPFNNTRAWVVLIAAIIALSIVCWGLAEAVTMAAHALNVPVYFTAVILAAAATSVPDTILSLQDALKGNYDDAVSNAVGSNIFDITISLGFPLLLYTLLFGPVELIHAAGESAAEVQELRIVLLVISAILIATLWLRSKKIGKETGLILLGLYIGWITWIIFKAFS